MAVSDKEKVKYRKILASKIDWEGGYEAAFCSYGLEVDKTIDPELYELVEKYKEASTGIEKIMGKYLP